MGWWGGLGGFEKKLGHQPISCGAGCVARPFDRMVSKPSLGGPKGQEAAKAVILSWYCLSLLWKDCVSYSGEGRRKEMVKKENRKRLQVVTNNLMEKQMGADSFRLVFRKRDSEPTVAVLARDRAILTERTGIADPPFLLRVLCLNVLGGNREYMRCSQPKRGI